MIHNLFLLKKYLKNNIHSIIVCAGIKKNNLANQKDELNKEKFTRAKIT